MKRFVIALSIIILLAMIPSCFPILAQPTHIPHQNPATAKVSPDLAPLLLFYGNVFELASMSQYRDSQSMLNELEQANIPDELQYLIDRYNTRSEQLITILNTSEFLLHEASILFSQDQTSEAKQKLGEAEVYISSAQLLLEDIEAATNTVSDKLGVFSAAAGSQIRQAYDRLEESQDRLSQLIDKLSQLGEDIAENPQRVITTSFYYPTRLEVSVPETAYPGLPISVSGQVSSTHGKPERTIKVLLDNNQLAEETIQGEFNIQIRPPPQTPTGKHSLTVVTAPQGRYAGASKSLPINISVLPIRTKMQIPLLTVIPKTIRISGKVYHGPTPIEDARVSLAFKEATTIVKTSTDGSFTTTIEAPFDLSLLGPQELITTIQPVEPWYASLKTRRRIFTLNPANIGVMLGAFISLGLLVLKRARTRPPHPREEMAIPQAELPELLGVTPPELKYELTGIKGKILSAYLNGLETVENVTGIPLMPNTTLREFVNAASPLLPSAIKPFTELTTIAEYTLYSSHKLDENVAAKAELLAGIIKEELHNGAA